MQHVIDNDPDFPELDHLYRIVAVDGCDSSDVNNDDKPPPLISILMQKSGVLNFNN